VGGIPKSVVAVDVETTGLHSNDRIVSLGAWRLDANGFSTGFLNTRYVYIIADPGRKSHPRAEEVRGYSDWTLRHQEPFSKHADEIRHFLLSGDIVVAHNASFDLQFIDREYRALGQKPLDCRCFCTMNEYRRSGLPGNASLSAVCQRMGMERIGKTHGALEDAWLALMIYLWLNKAPSNLIRPFSGVIASGISTTPTNFKRPTPEPDGPLPRRRRAAHPIATSNAGAGVDSAKSKLMKAIRPTAIMLLEIARADESIAAAEIDIITSLIRTTCNRLHIPLNEELVQKVLADLFAINISQNLLTRSARGICADLVARSEFPKWLAEMARTAGGVSAVKWDTIGKVKAAIQKAVSKEH
jgi:DNA polymerase III subunit epsilon